MLLKKSGLNKWIVIVCSMTMPAPNVSTFDLSILPSEENDGFEFKSSITPPNDLNKKLVCAASGFANSGGGCFVAGVDNHGNADGGLSNKIGRQDIRDWADQIIHQVEPTPSYEIKLTDDPKGRGTIKPDCCVLVVVVNESHAGPHMGPDGRYYIRAGAHTVLARHFIIDAIWAKRHFSKPRLTHVFRPKPDDQQVIQLGIVALTPAPAVDVEIDLSPLGEFLRGNEKFFPLRLSVIDRDNPFFIDVTTWFEAERRFGKDVKLQLSYKDLANNPYSHQTKINVSNSISPLIIGGDASKEMVKSLESIASTLKGLAKKRSDRNTG